MAEGRKLYMLRFACGHYRGVVSDVELNDRQQREIAANVCDRCGEGQESKGEPPQQKQPEELLEEQRKEKERARMRAYYHANKKKILAKQRKYRKAKRQAGA